MKIKKLLQETRSYRRFQEDRKVERGLLLQAVENVRYAPSPANLQPLKFRIVTDRQERSRIFPLLTWAGYLKDWPGPAAGERPSAYIVILGDRSRSKYIDWDYGISLLTILLSLREKGLGACTIAACDKKVIKEVLEIRTEWEVAAVVAVGFPAEEVTLEDVKNDDIKYYRDPAGVHHVPKRILKDLVYPES